MKQQLVYTHEREAIMRYEREVMLMESQQAFSGITEFATTLVPCQGTPMGTHLAWHKSCGD